MNLDRVRAYLGKGHWFRKVSAVGTISIGRHIYQLGYDWRPDRYAELRFDAQASQFVCSATSGKEKLLPVDWLTKEELMGIWLSFSRSPSSLRCRIR